MRRRPSAQALAAAAGAVAAAACVLALAGLGRNAGPAPADPVRPPTTARDAMGHGVTSPTGEPTRAAATTPHPGAGLGLLAIPRLDVRAEVTDVRDPGGTLQVPGDPAQVGWWSQGVGPGTGHGSVVVDGHVNLNGVAGAFAAVARATAGDLVTLRVPGASRTFRYVVDMVRRYDKEPGLPPDVFNQSGPERLVLITCGGRFDASTGNYTQNVIAFAHRA